VFTIESTCKTPSLFIYPIKITREKTRHYRLDKNDQKVTLALALKIDNII